MKQRETASKSCQKHGHSAMLQLSLLSQNLRTISSGNRDTGQLSPCSNLELDSFKEHRGLFYSFFKSRIRVDVTYLLGT